MQTEHAGFSGRFRVLAALLFGAASAAADAAQVDIIGPPGSVSFGASIAVLPDGKFAVADPDGPISGVGAVYLYAADGTLISTLTGVIANDHVGSGGVYAVGGGVVACSPQWHDGSTADVGAVTWISGTTGLQGIVTSANSLVGTAAGASVCGGGVFVLSNGNYLVRSPDWDAAGATSAGAVTFGAGGAPLVAQVSSLNSLVGASANDVIGRSGLNEPGIFELANGNYVVASPRWNNNTAIDAGAATWGSGTSGVSGVVSAANSLVGTTSNDFVAGSLFGIVVLTNGNYVVGAGGWDRGAIVDAGASIFGSGTTGIIGPVSEANSLFGSVNGDTVGGQAYALSNGNYVVSTQAWRNNGVANAGAVTWANGTTGRTGPVTTANSFVGTTQDTFVGGNVIPLTNGNYVITAFSWDNGPTQDVGATTWANGTTGLVGSPTTANSLFGTTTGDAVGFVFALANGNYVVGTPNWNNASIVDAGAATWCNGSTGTTGIVSPSNSLVGSSANDRVGFFGNIVALDNGNYVVTTPDFDNGIVADVGAITWGNGTTGRIGTINSTTSVLGSTPGDRVGSDAGEFSFIGAYALPGGSFAVRAPTFDANGIVDTGAVFWGRGDATVAGFVNAENSLLGSTENDRVGAAGVIALPNGGYVVRNDVWDNVGLVDAGAVTFGRSYAGVVGTIEPTYSVLGTAAGGGTRHTQKFDAPRNRLLVGRPASSIVTIITHPSTAIFGNGFE